MAVSCVVGAAQPWLPFSDPAVEETPLLECFQARIDTELTRQTQLTNVTTFEKHPHHLLRILRRCNYNVEQSVQDWYGWITWRREQLIDEITDDIIRSDVDAKLIEWTKTHDKLGRLCCVVTGRHMNPEERRKQGGTGLSFQKYLIRSVEDGCRLAMMEESSATSSRSARNSGPPTQQQIDREHDDIATTSDTNVHPDTSPGPDASPSPGLDAGPDFCIVYDRRGLDWQHIDPMLYKLSRNTIDELRVSVIYCFLFLYNYLVYPPLTLTHMYPMNTSYLLSLPIQFLPLIPSPPFYPSS